MFPIKNKNVIQLSIITIPVIASVFAVKMFSVTICVLAAILLILLVNLMPSFHKHETKWMLLMTLFFTIPVNVRLITISSFINEGLFESVLLKIVGYPSLYIIMLCTEELIMCTLSAGLAQIKYRLLNKLLEG